LRRIEIGKKAASPFCGKGGPRGGIVFSISRPGAPPRSIESGAKAAEKMIGAKSLDKAIEVQS
jgi:hypothetical protein